MSSGDEQEMSGTESSWDESMEMALFYAAIKFKPVGMHKHFRMVNLHKHFNKHSPTPCTIAELWEKLGTMYDLQTLDEREDSGLFADEDEEEEEDSDEEGEKDFSFKNSEEFVLPLHEYDHLVTEVAVREPSRNPSPSPMRTTRAQREGSQTPSVADSSRASSPEEDDMPRKRRTSRATKKSDVNETSSPRTSSTTTASSTRRATRAKAESAPVTTRGARKTGKKVVVAKVDAAVEKSVASKYGVSGYPTLKYFPSTSLTSLIEYSGGRTRRKRPRPRREPPPNAGRIFSLDSIASQFALSHSSSSSSPKEKKMLTEQGLKAANESGDRNAKHYARVFEKAGESLEFIAAETARLARIIQEGTLSPIKLDEFSIRHNIISAFALPPSQSTATDQAENLERDEL